jgi:hypothetical protein
VCAGEEEKERERKEESETGRVIEGGEREKREGGEEIEGERGMGCGEVQRSKGQRVTEGLSNRAQPTEQYRSHQTAFHSDNIHAQATQDNTHTRQDTSNTTRRIRHATHPLLPVRRELERFLGRCHLLE